MENISDDLIELKYHTHAYVDDHYKLLSKTGSKKSVVITPSDRNNCLSKPEERPVFQKHPKTPNYFKGG